MQVLPPHESSSATRSHAEDTSSATPPTGIAQQLINVSPASHADSVPPLHTASPYESYIAASELLDELHLRIYQGRSGDSAIDELNTDTRSELAILSDYFQHDSITEEGQTLCSALRAETGRFSEVNRSAYQGFRFLPLDKMEPRLCYYYKKNRTDGQYQLFKIKRSTYLEAQLVWANLTQEQRNDWTMSAFADHFKIRRYFWFRETNLQGQLLTYWIALGKGWHNGSATRFTAETLLTIQDSYKTVPGTQESRRNTAILFNVSPQLIARYIFVGGDLSRHGKLFLALTRLAQAGPRAMEQRWNIVYRLRQILPDQPSDSSALRCTHQLCQDKLSLLARLHDPDGLTAAGQLLIRKIQNQLLHPVWFSPACPDRHITASRIFYWQGAPTPAPAYTTDICRWVPCAPSRQLVRNKAKIFLTLDLQLVWASLRQEQRTAWTIEQFTIHFGVPLMRWACETNIQGHLLRQWSDLVDGWQDGCAQPVTLELLTQLQAACRLSSVQPCDRQYLAQEHGISDALLERYIEPDGRLTPRGESYVMLMQDAIAGPQVIATPLLQRELLQLLHQAPATDINNATMPLPSSPPATSGRIRRASTPVSCETADKRIKPDPEAPLQRIVHEPQHTLPVLQAPVQPQSSLLEQQGLVDMIEVSEWYEMEEVLAALPPRQKAQIKRRITREVRNWLTPGVDHENRFGQKFDVAEDLTQDHWSGRGLFARTDIRQFEVLGPYAGTLHEQVGPALPTLSTARRQQGAGRILEYSWTTAAGNVISGYRTGNLLSLMNTAAMNTCTGTSALAPVNNVAAIAFGHNFIFYIAKQDIKKGSQLLVNYGSAYNPHAHTVKEDPEATVQNQ